MRLLSLLLLLTLWQVAAWAWHNSLLPTPLEVLRVMVTDTLSGELPRHLGATLARVVVAFLIAMTIGSILGIVMGRWQRIDQLLDTWLIFFLNLPALVTIILIYIWFGLGESAAILAIVINKVPNVVVTLREGARTLDPGYQQMARTFRLSRKKVLRHIILPQLMPYFAVAARSGLALIWKIVLVVELLGRSNGVGFQLHLFFQMFDVTSILAYSLSFILVMLVIEYAILQPFERRANQWRN